MECLYWPLAILVATAIVFEAYLRITQRAGREIKIIDIWPNIAAVADAGLGGSRVRIMRPISAGRIDCVKHISNSGEERLCMEITEASCSACDFRAAQDALRAKGIGFAVAADAKGRRLIVVDCGLDHTIASRAARTVMMEVWGLSMDDLVRMRLKGDFSVRKQLDIRP